MADATRGRVRVEPGRKRVRAMLGGETLADTTRPLLVWEVPYYPTYYFPADDVRTDLLAATGESARSPSRGTAEIHDASVVKTDAAGIAHWYRTSELDEIANHIRFDWGAMDAWFEEDEEVYVHARDPYTRVDALPSSRHMRIEIDGVEIADTRRPHLLFETGLPTRHYIPKHDIRMDLLVPSDLETECPYKGAAHYYDVDVGSARHEGVAWWYPIPVEESSAIAGLVAFYDERVDTWVDGGAQDRPRTKFA